MTIHEEKSSSTGCTSGCCSKTTQILASRRKHMVFLLIAIKLPILMQYSPISHGLRKAPAPATVKQHPVLPTIAAPQSPAIALAVAVAITIVDSFLLGHGTILHGNDAPSMATCRVGGIATAFGPQDGSRGYCEDSLEVLYVVKKSQGEGREVQLIGYASGIAFII
jgi:hypothetical protein